MALKQAIGRVGLGCFAALACVGGGSAQGAYTGLTVQLHTTINSGGIPRAAYRVYARFSHPADVLVAWYGDEKDPVEIRSLTAAGEPGSNFFNPGGPDYGNTAPSMSQILCINPPCDPPEVPSIQWGTFATVGVNVAEQGSGAGGPGVLSLDETQVGPPTNFIGGPDNEGMNQFIAPLEVFAPPPPGGDGQGQADYANDGDGFLRVLVMQLAVNLGDHVEGEVDLRVRLPGGDVDVVFDDESFSSFAIPSCADADISPAAGDLVVNVNDLLAVIAAWGPCGLPPQPCPADVHPPGKGDDTVDIGDMLFVIEHWGVCQ